MIFFNPIVISNKIQHNNGILKVKSFAASLLVHIAVVSAAFYLSINHRVEFPKENPIMISLADYTPAALISDRSKAPLHHPSALKAEHTPPLLTSQERLPHTPAASPEASVPQSTPVRPRVAPSDIQLSTQESPHSILNPVANDSPHDASSLNQTDKFPKPNVSTEDINGATLGRIRAMIESSLTYPSIARKLRLEGTVIVSFILKPDGLVERAEILTSSGSNLLDTKAIQTVLALSGEYPSPVKTVYLKIPIAFSLTKS